MKSNLLPDFQRRNRIHHWTLLLYRSFIFIFDGLFTSQVFNITHLMYTNFKVNQKLLFDLFLF